MGDLGFYKNICSHNFPRAIFHVHKVKFVNKTIISGMASFTLISSWLLLNIILSASWAKPTKQIGDSCHGELECPYWLLCDARTNKCEQYDNSHFCDTDINCPPGEVCHPMYPIGEPWSHSYCV